MILLQAEPNAYRLWIFVGALILIGVFAIYVYVKVSGKEKAKVLQLKDEYDAALKSGNKQVALQKGRQYYQKLRGTGQLTIYDEQAITNDISTM